MKSLNEVLKELEKVNKEEPDSPKFNLETLSVYYVNVDKTDYYETLADFERWARWYLVIHLKAKVQNEVWSKYTFPLNDMKLAEQFYEEDRTIVTPKYKEIEETWLN